MCVSIHHFLENKKATGAEITGLIADRHLPSDNLKNNNYRYYCFSDCHWGGAGQLLDQ